VSPFVPRITGEAVGGDATASGRCESHRESMVEFGPPSASRSGGSRLESRSDQPCSARFPGMKLLSGVRPLATAGAMFDVVAERGLCEGQPARWGPSEFRSRPRVPAGQ
jgi:hypothetical protein